ncbi:25071_t:CDS:1 [Dentiscutata erythropus]|uniref:25071_t:CDS:1 n=1 Tax=Dentiscutata erythropus TaxID=1348616 RepID=A0A9N9JKL6_9GLOM|nr:25071_t:CDS:1 [Dentiscutata erythropus]
MSSNFILSCLPSFRGISNGPSLISISNGRPWISTQYFKFKLITDKSIDVIANTFLQEMTPSDQPRLKYNFMSAATRCLLYGRVGDRELTMVMKVECVVNLYYVDCFDHANSFDIVHVSVCNLIDENICVREARALRYIYTDRFDMYIEDTTRYRHTLDKLVDHRKIQVTRSLSSGWEVTSLSAGINNLSSTIITQYYNWEGVRLASKILNRNNYHQLIYGFVTKIFELERFIYVSMYTGRQNKFNRKIYKREKRKVYSSVIPIPYELCEDIFLKFAKNIDFKGRYIEMFKEDGERMLDTIMQFYNEEKKQLDEDVNVVESQVINDVIS